MMHLFKNKKLVTLRRKGFRARMATAGGKNVLKRRRAKGKEELTVSDKYRKIGKAPNKRIR